VGAEGRAQRGRVALEQVPRFAVVGLDRLRQVDDDGLAPPPQQVVRGVVAVHDARPPQRRERPHRRLEGAPPLVGREPYVGQARRRTARVAHEAHQHHLAGVADVGGVRADQGLGHRHPRAEQPPEHRVLVSGPQAPLRPASGGAALGERLLEAGVADVAARPVAPVVLERPDGEVAVDLDGGEPQAGAAEVDGGLLAALELALDGVEVAAFEHPGDLEDGRLGSATGHELVGAEPAARLAAVAAAGEGFVAGFVRVGVERPLQAGLLRARAASSRREVRRPGPTGSWAGGAETEARASRSSARRDGLGTAVGAGTKLGHAHHLLSDVEHHGGSRPQARRARAGRQAPASTPGPIGSRP
jgi:hypothetical protein